MRKTTIMQILKSVAMLVAVPLVCVVSACAKDVCTFPPAQGEGFSADTSFCVSGDYARVEWDSAGSFLPPYTVEEVSAGHGEPSVFTTRACHHVVDIEALGGLAEVRVTSAGGSSYRAVISSRGAGGLSIPIGVAAVLAAICGVCTWVYVRHQKRKLAEARDQLANANVPQSNKYEFATVLFSDIQGFTKIAEHTNPELLVDELDRYFIYFDELVEKYGVEKIKTIGDAYMCAGGVPDHDSANPIEVVLVGLEMIEYVQERRNTETGFWNIRVGVNTGPVISGYLGSLKKVFDIWGDSVNTASRMESSSEPGRVNISANTYDKIQDYFVCEHRGRMPVKYKGEIDMYFVNSLKPEYCLPGTTCKPNALLMRKLQMLKVSDFEEKVRDTCMRGTHPNISMRMDMLLSRIRTLASMEGLSDDEVITSTVAAIFCFVREEFPQEKSLHSKASADELMKKMHLADAQKEHINKLVTHYEMKKTPEAREEEVIQDAFNEVFGRKDIIPLLLAHYDDIVSRGTGLTRNEWLMKQRNLLSSFVYYTASAKVLCEVSRPKQVEILDAMISL